MKIKILLLYIPVLYYAGIFCLLFLKPEENKNYIHYLDHRLDLFLFYFLIFVLQKKYERFLLPKYLNDLF